MSGNTYPFYGIPSVIAVNMIMSVAAGGTTAVLIATWAQVRGPLTAAATGVL